VQHILAFSRSAVIVRHWFELARELGPDRCHSASECFALTRDVRESVLLMIEYLRRPDLLDADWVSPWTAVR
jgi:hypothetical protein